MIVEGEFVRISDEDMRKAVDQMTELALVTVTRVSACESGLVGSDPGHGESRLPRQSRERQRVDGADGGPSSRAERRRSGSRATPSSASARATSAAWRARRPPAAPGLLVVVGGDGSVNEVANGLVVLDERPPVAIVPRGTGWDFVRTFGIPRNVEQAARVALAGNEREIDLGLVTYRAWAATRHVRRLRTSPAPA